MYSVAFACVHLHAERSVVIHCSAVAQRSLHLNRHWCRQYTVCVCKNMNILQRQIHASMHMCTCMHTHTHTQNHAPPSPPSPSWTLTHTHSPGAGSLSLWLWAFLLLSFLEICGLIIAWFIYYVKKLLLLTSAVFGQTHVVSHYFSIICKQWFSVFRNMLLFCMRERNRRSVTSIRNMKW